MGGGGQKPATKWLATAGFGIWTPDTNETQVEMDERSNANRFTFSVREKGGLKQWASFPGQRCSSTRVETAAAVMSLVQSVAIHMGTDSAAMMGKARKLQTVAINLMDSVVNNWRPSRNPFGKPWGLQTDGDLWKNMWDATLIRGPKAHCITKVKGHATAKDVGNQLATQRDKEGNDEADDCATKGVDSMGLKNATMWLARRHEAYTGLMKRIYIMIIKVLQKKKGSKN